MPWVRGLPPRHLSVEFWALALPMARQVAMEAQALEALAASVALAASSLATAALSGTGGRTSAPGGLAALAAVAALAALAKGADGVGQRGGALPVTGKLEATPLGLEAPDQRVGAGA